MKRVALFLLVCAVVAFANPAACSKGSITIPLFGATPYNVSPDVSHRAFKTKTVTMICEEGDYVRIRGTLGKTDRAPSSGELYPGDGYLIVDNYLTVNGTNVCVGGYRRSAPAPGTNCFGAFIPRDRRVKETGAYKSSEEIYDAIAPIDVEVGTVIAPGKSEVEFRLMDFGGFYANTELWLETSCGLPDYLEIPEIVRHLTGGGDSHHVNGCRLRTVS